MSKSNPAPARMPRAIASLLLLAGLSMTSLAAHGEVVVADAWARATVPHQKAGGAFMTLTSDQDTRLVTASSPAAGRTEIHEMKIEDNVMKMKAIDSLPLRAGQAVELKPGGYHLMLMQLPAPLEAGTTISVTLEFEGAGGARSTTTVEVPVRPLTATPGHGH